MEAGPLAIHEQGAALGPEGMEPGWPCKKAPGLNKVNLADSYYWMPFSYPPVSGLAHGMSILPLDAVLVLDVENEYAAPYSNGTLLFGSVTPARAGITIAVQLIVKNGSVPWSAEVGVTGHLVHTGVHLSLSGASGPAPELKPLHDAAISRLIELMK